VRQEGLKALTDEGFVDALYWLLLDRAPDPDGRAFMLERLSSGIDRLDLIDLFTRSTEFGHKHRQLAFAPSGHFYSPLPGPGEIDAHQAFDWDRASVPGIALREAAQMELLRALSAHYDAVPFAAQPSQKARYGYDNGFFGEADAVILFAMIRHLSPKRIIEVGSGHSSCVILDTVDRLGHDVSVTFIEPYPAILKSRLRPGDLDRNRLVEQGLQKVPLSVFAELEAGDILFVDSSHVSKLASDLNYLMFEILPVLRPGVFVHIHDVIYPFEYPMLWYQQGRAWNEAYLLRAFLQFNESWRIELFSSFIIRRHMRWFEQHMPVTLRNTGGHVWISRVR
jgi:hypothetical protein